MADFSERTRFLRQFGIWLIAASFAVFLIFYSANRFFPDLVPVPAEEGMIPQEALFASPGPFAAALLEGKTAPPIALPAADGTKVHLPEKGGRPTVLLFWASWNEESKSSLEIFAGISARFPGVRFITISSQEPEALIQNYLRRQQISLSVLLDSDGNATQAYQVEFLPTIVFVDTGGTITSVLAGPLREEEIEAGIAALLR